MNGYSELRPLGSAAADWSGSPLSVASGLLAQARGLEVVAGLATRLATALAPALLIVIAASVAMATPGTLIYLQATLWAGGFLCYALAIESHRPGRAVLLVVSGLAIQTLTWLSGRHGPELAVLAATLVALWIAAAVLRGYAHRA
jgi:hypothetical protein